MGTPLGGVTETVLDGQLGLVQPTPGLTPMIMGVSSAGTVNTMKLYAPNSQAQIVTDWGYGPGPQQAARQSAKGATVGFCKTGNTTAGAQGSVSAFATGTSVVTTTGTANDTYPKIVFLVVTGATIGVAGASFQISFDNGETFGPITPLGTANVYLIPNTGITLHFAAGTLVAGESCSFTTTEPKWSATDIGTALDAIGVGGIAFDFIHIVGSCNSTEAATIQTKLQGFATAKRYVRAIVETVRMASSVTWSAANDATWQAVLIADWATFTEKRMLVAAGDLRTVSAIDQSVYLRPVAWHCCELACKFDSARYELGRVKNDGSGTGALDASLVDRNGNAIGHNEVNYPGLDSPLIASQGFTTARTYASKGKAVYITEGKLFSPMGSDFSTWRLGRVEDIGQKSMDDYFTNEVQETPPVTSTGTIQPAYADFLENGAKARIDDDLVNQGRAVDRTVTVDRSVNILTTKTDNVAIRILPYGEEKYINLTIGFAATLPTA
jgi:hypothetical protein